jgi:uncharacterized protein
MEPIITYPHPLAVAFAGCLYYNPLATTERMLMRFEWDPTKAARNLKDHKVSFNEAATVFGDPLGVTVPDPDHSDEEDRLIIVGLSYRSRLLIVSHTENEDVIRIISARELTPREREQYEQGDF